MLVTVVALTLAPWPLRQHSYLLTPRPRNQGNWHQVDVTRVFARGQCDICRQCKSSL